MPSLHVSQWSHVFTEKSPIRKSSRFPLPSGRRVHNGLASLLAKGLLKVLSVVGSEEVSCHGLTAILVYPLEDLRFLWLEKKSSSSPFAYPSSCKERRIAHLVARRIAETGEEREELGPNSRSGLLLEDDGI